MSIINSNQAHVLLQYYYLLSYTKLSSKKAPGKNEGLSFKAPTPFDFTMHCHIHINKWIKYEK
jgi:hypothetical protein